MFIRIQCLNRIIKHCIYKLSIGGYTDCPGYGKSIKAINYWRKINLACWNIELSNIRQPHLIGLIRMKISLYKVWDSR